MNALARTVRGPARRLYASRRFSLEGILGCLSRRPNGVMHVGGNFGTEAEAYAAAGIGKVVWIEGHPGYFKALSEHVAKFAGQEAHCVLVSDRDGEQVTFRVASNTGSSTMFVPSGAFREHFPQIGFVDELHLVAGRLDTYFNSRASALSGCDFLVLDLEGAELKALRGMGSLLDQFSGILCEVSIAKNFEGGPLLPDIDRFLATRGFVRRRLWIGYSSGDAVYVRKSVTLGDRALARLESMLLRASYEAGLLRLRRRLLEAVKQRVLAD